MKTLSNVHGINGGTSSINIQPSIGGCTYDTTPTGINYNFDISCSSRDISCLSHPGNWMFC